jgi:hypothetical protein
MSGQEKLPGAPDFHFWHTSYWESLKNDGENEVRDDI